MTTNVTSKMADDVFQLDLRKVESTVMAEFKRYARIVAARYPIGTVIETKLGRATVQGTVIRLPDPNSYTIAHRYNEVTIQNDLTGKIRTFQVWPDHIPKVIRKAP